MTRTLPHERAALDVLDQLHFDQLLVFCFYQEHEHEWLRRIVSRVQTAVAQTGAAGATAECLKHMVLCLMEISLQGSLYELPAQKPVPMPPELTPELVELLETRNREFFLAMVIAFASKARETSSETAIEIANQLLGEFQAAPVTVRFRLVERCLASEHPLAPLEFFCWLFERGVISGGKYRGKNVTTPTDSSVIIRVGLLCEFETIRTQMITWSNSQESPRHLFRSGVEMSENARSQLIERYRHYLDLAFARKRSMLAFFPDRIEDSSYARRFFQDYGQICFRTRLMPGTQAGWLGTLGAAMTRIYHGYIAPDKPVYVELNNEGSVTEHIAGMLADRGHTISARTLYNKNKAIVGETGIRLQGYYRALKKLETTPPANIQDLIYDANIVATSA